MLIERDVYNIVEKIRNYDSNLRLKYMEGNSNYSDAPYALFELCADGIERLVFTIWELDERILTRLRQSDNQLQNVLNGLEDNNAAVQASLNRRYQDMRDEKHDIAKHVFKSPKGRYSYRDDKGSLIVIDDDPARKGRNVVESRGD